MFQGRFIGYTTEYVEFFIPQDGDYLEIPLHVQPDGSFCDTVQFSRDQYDLALFADKFMFRIALEQGKTYTAEFDLREEGVETNFSFTGEGEAENTFMAHLWALNIEEEVDKASSFKEFRSIMANCYRPLREELSAIPNKPFVKYYKAELSRREKYYSYYFPFYYARESGSCPDDPDFNAFVALSRKMSEAMERPDKDGYNSERQDPAQELFSSGQGGPCDGTASSRRRSPRRSGRGRSACTCR